MSTAPAFATARRHIVTINVEDYFQVGAFSQLIPFAHWERFEGRVQRNTEATLALLEQTRNRATFFASGWMAENQPGILRRIVEQGHEVACQGYHQQSVRELPPAAFRDDLTRSRAAVEDATGRAVQGFRIGRGWIGPDDLWALDVLAEEGFRFDSSLCPRRRQFAREPGRFIVHRHRANGGALWEVPVSAARLAGFAVPFSGGNYVRQLPEWPVREAVARWTERREGPLVMYFHIWELDTEQPAISAASWVQRLRHYRNLGAMPGRMRYFLERYPFTSISDYLSLADEPAAARAVTAEPRDEAPATVTSPGPAQGARELTVVVPCYNEEASLAYLERTLAAFSAAHAHDLRLSFVFVDDGSTDATWDRLEALFGRRPDCTLLRHARNRGIAAAIVTGIAHARTELVAVVDADCTFDPMQLGDMVRQMAPDVAAVAASPFHASGRVANVPPWRLALSRGAAFLYRCVLNHQFSSYTSCFRIYRRSAVEGIGVWKSGFCGVAEILARLDLAGHRLVECPAELETRVLGQSKINLLRTIADHLHLLARLACARWLGIPLPDGYRP